MRWNDHREITVTSVSEGWVASWPGTMLCVWPYAAPSLSCCVCLVSGWVCRQQLKYKAIPCKWTIKIYSISGVYFRSRTGFNVYYPDGTSLIAVFTILLSWWNQSVYVFRAVCLSACPHWSVCVCTFTEKCVSPDWSRNIRTGSVYIVEDYLNLFNFHTYSVGMYDCSMGLVYHSLW